MEYVLNEIIWQPKNNTHIIKTPPKTRNSGNIFHGELLIAKVLQDSSQRFCARSFPRHFSSAHFWPAFWSWMPWPPEQFRRLQRWRVESLVGSFPQEELKRLNPPPPPIVKQLSSLFWGLSMMLWATWWKSIIVWNVRHCILPVSFHDYTSGQQHKW